LLGRSVRHEPLERTRHTRPARARCRTCLHWHIGFSSPRSSLAPQQWRASPVAQAQLVWHELPQYRTRRAQFQAAYCFRPISGGSPGLNRSKLARSARPRRPRGLTFIIECYATAGRPSGRLVVRPRGVSGACRWPRIAGAPLPTENARQGDHVTLYYESEPGGSA
jgi:hypothetical protein